MRQHHLLSSWKPFVGQNHGVKFAIFITATPNYRISRMDCFFRLTRILLYRAWLVLMTFWRRYSFLIVKSHRKNRPTTILRLANSVEMVRGTKMTNSFVICSGTAVGWNSNSWKPIRNVLMSFGQSTGHATYREIPSQLTLQMLAGPGEHQYRSLI